MLRFDRPLADRLRAPGVVLSLLAFLAFEGLVIANREPAAAAAAAACRATLSVVLLL